MVISLASAASPPKLEPAKAAKSAGLHYVSDTLPGIRRKGKPGRFSYVLPAGAPVRDAQTRGRINRLAIPPAWTNVWICPLEDGHLQAVGRDARGRKQYIYHPRWREVRDEAKYGRMLAFAKALPVIRKKIRADLALRGLSRDKVLAAVVHLLEVTLIRIGNDEYATQNRSYGLTTIRDRHVRVRGPRITFDFVGKAGVRHRIDVEDPHLAKIVRRCQDLPGQELFAYLDESGQVRDVTSDDVNEYLRTITGEDFTAKDFRTWAGTVLAAVALREFAPFASNREAKRNITKAIESVSRMLGNTPSVCRKCYVHPEILNSYLDGQTVSTLKQRADRRIQRNLHQLKPEEAAVITFLRERLQAAAANHGSSLKTVLARSLSARSKGRQTVPPGRPSRRR